MDDSDSFEIQCQKCGTPERLTFSEMKTRELIQCTRCGAIRGMGKENLLETCREAAKTMRQRL
ncbi:hypothetical protein D9M68_560710 [compost metagenome]